jgi:histidyl-tRNA synthetase
MQKATELLGQNENGRQGLEELQYVLSRQSSDSNLQPDFTLARGLNYYTGIIFEVKANDVQIGSIGGGGRYDDLTGLFGVPNIPGVGISFGVDRIYDVMETLNSFPADASAGTKVLLFNLGENEEKHAYSIAQLLRRNNISCEIFHENSKFDKQFKYAERKKIPFVIIMGSKEVESGTCQVKDLRNGEQKTISQDELKNFVFE